MPTRSSSSRLAWHHVLVGLAVLGCGGPGAREASRPGRAGAPAVAERSPATSTGAGNDAALAPTAEGASRDDDAPPPAPTDVESAAASGEDDPAPPVTPTGRVLARLSLQERCAVELRADGVGARCRGEAWTCRRRLEADLTPAEAPEVVYGCAPEGGDDALVVVASGSRVFARAVREGRLEASASERLGGPRADLVLRRAAGDEDEQVFLRWDEPRAWFVELLRLRGAPSAARWGPGPTVEVPGVDGAVTRYAWSDTEGRFTSASSGLRVAFGLLWLDDDARVAVPLACHMTGGPGTGGFAPNARACLSLLPPHPVLGVRRGARTLEAGALAADDHGNVGLRLQHVPERSYRATFPADLADPSVRCAARVGDPAGSPVSETSLRAFEARAGALPAPIRAALRDGAFTLDEMIAADFDGDGRRDHWASVRFASEVEDGRDTAAIVARFGGRGALQLVELTSGAEAVFARTDAPSYAGDRYIALGASDCSDLDGDGAVEVLLAYGGDSERHYDYVGYRDGRLVVLGSGYASGD